MKLNHRLQAVSDLFIQYHKGNILADIGTDHAYLPAFLSLEGYITSGYACDISIGPLQLAKKTLNKYHIKNVIPLLGSGITPVIDQEVTDISICGMGGQLIIDILDEHTDYLKDKRLFLQANTANYELRQYLLTHYYKIIDEAIVEDMGHIYEIQVCEYSNELIEYSELDFIFGPVLRVKKGEVFKKKWQFESSIQQRILDSVDESHEAYTKAYNYKQLIEAMLNEGN